MVVAHPVGTVTLLFTDVEGSTQLLQALGDRYGGVLADHHRLLREAFAAENGSERGTAGDGLYYTFPSARNALAAAIAGQRALAGHTWPDGADVRVRMGIHTGEPSGGEGGYVGLDVHRASRIADAGHGGQILVSRTTRDLVADEAQDSASFADLGEHRLKGLSAAERIYQVRAPGLPWEFPPLRSIDARPNNLPRQLTSFIGQASTLAEAKRLLGTTPLLTLTGPGGVGKTRLALELAGDVLEDFEGGVWFVELGSLTDPGLVVSTIATALGVVETPGRPLLASIADRIEGRPLLLVLDSCEHVLEGAAETVDALLRACREIRILATSREGIGIPGEAVFPVPSLSLSGDEAGRPDVSSANSEAVRLFAERAMAVLPSFRLTDSNLPYVVSICRHLDGIPLAIELAAARVRALTVQQIADRLHDRFRLLTGSGRLVVPRHQTLRATMDWSHELLADEERKVFRRLSVFAASCSLEAAEVVCAGGSVTGPDVLDVLSRLVDKSLVVSDVGAAEHRYRFLETVRQYARDRLLESGEATDVMRRHRDWFLVLIERAAPAFFRGAESRAEIDLIELEHDNLRAALQWSEDEQGEQGTTLRLAAGLWRFWEMRGYVLEGRGRIERALGATAGEESSLRADALTGAGVLAYREGDLRAAADFHEESLTAHLRLGDPDAAAYASNNLANVFVLLGEYAKARELYEELLAAARKMRDPRVLGFALINSADVVARQGDVAGGKARFDEGIAAFRGISDEWGEAFALDSLSVATLRYGDVDSARSAGEQALAISRRIGDQRGVARALAHLADVANEQGDRAQAKQLILQSLGIRQSVGDQPGICAAMEKLAWIVMGDDPPGAACLIGAAEALRESIRTPLPPASRSEYDVQLSQLRSHLDEEAFQQARRDGRQLTPTEAAARVAS